MDAFTAEPDLARREHLETCAIVAMAGAVGAVLETWDRQELRVGAPGSGGQPWSARGSHRDAVLRQLTTFVLRAVLAEFVQSGLEVRVREQIARLTAQADAVTEAREFLRIVRIRGIDSLVERLDRQAALTRAEHLRLRASAERVISSIGSDPPPGGPGQLEVLRRLQSTGVDLR